MRIEVLNWKKFNPRTDVAQASWFRLENTFWMDDAIWALDSDGKMVWLMLLGLASGKSAGAIDVDPDFVATNLRVSVEVVIKALDHLEAAGKIQIQASRPRNARVTRTARPRTAGVTAPSRTRDADVPTDGRTDGRDGRTVPAASAASPSTVESEREPRSSADPQRESSAPPQDVASNAALAADAAAAAPVEPEVLLAERPSGEPRSAGPPARRERRTLKMTTPGSEVFAAYSAAYQRRYGIEPVRDAKANSICAQLVGRLGIDEASAVVAFYLTHGKTYYAERMHDLSVCLADCTGLRTQMLTGRKMTSAEARRGDVNQANADTFREVFEKLNEEGLLK